MITPEITSTATFYFDLYKLGREIHNRRPPDDDEAMVDWTLELLSFCEILAFLYNHAMLDYIFINHYADMIIDYYDGVLIKQGEALKKNYVHHPDIFLELHKLVKVIKSKRHNV